MDYYNHHYVEEENVYDLLPRKAEVVERPPLHRSKHNGKLAPSYSTFGLAGTNRLQANCDGAGGKVMGKSGPEAKGSATMGRIGERPDPHAFLQKRQGEDSAKKLAESRHQKSRGQGALPPIENSAATSQKSGSKAPPVPRRTEKPVMGLVTEKNFVISNAVDNIMREPKKLPSTPTKATSRADYGEVPKYLRRIQEQRRDEDEYLQHLRQQQRQAQQGNSRMREMTTEEKDGLIARMREKWNTVHRQYLSLTFSLDTRSKIMRKEALEAELEQLEKAVAKLSRKVIYIYDDRPIDYNDYY